MFDIVVFFRSRKDLNNIQRFLYNVTCTSVNFLQNEFLSTASLCYVGLIVDF